MSTSTKGDLAMMVQAGSMKHREMMRVEMNNVKAVSYGEGYSEGFSDGYDAALKNIKEAAEKCAIGGKKKAETPELKPAILFLSLPLGKLIDKVVEEVDEVVQAYNDGEPTERIAEELADVQLAAETAMSKLPSYVQEKRRSTRIGCIEKNSNRGYYMPPRDKYGN